jgi:hypothetical protein
VLREISAQANEITEPAIDRFKVLVAAWGAAGESDRRRFLDHIGARLEIEGSATNGGGRDPGPLPEFLDRNRVQP